MKKITFSLRHLLPLFILLLSVNGLIAQQVIGSFPTMDGGFEGQAASGTMTSGSIASASTSSVWTTSSASLATFLTASPRTGLKYVNFVGGGTKRLQSPTFNATILTATQYTVQYYYRTTGATATGAFMQIGASIDGTQTPTYYPSGSPYVNLAGTSNAWTKYSAQFTLTTGGSSGKYGIGIIRTQSAIATSLDIDDVVMYAGGLDEVAPDPVTSPSIPAVAATQQTVSWTAPGTGIDGGGYMVIRGTSDPTTAPLVNGVYQVGNTVNTGQQVVYLGTSTSFVDLGLSASTHYYYRIYTVDKAFNYSTSIAIDGSTVAPSFAIEPTAQVTGINFSSVTSTGFTINWSPAVSGGGTNHLVIVKASSDITSDPVDGSSYSANTLLGGGSSIGGGSVVYNSTGTSVSVTGLAKAITYYIKIYDFNGSAGSENYIVTTPANSSQLTSPGEIFSTGSNRFIDGRTWNTTAAWVNGIVPGQADNVTIVTGDTLLITSTTASCFNLTIQPGAKLFINSSSATYHSFYGNSLTCNGVLGDKMTDGTTDCGFCMQFFGKMTISGTGTIRPNKIRPGTGATNASVTFASNTEVTYTSSSIISDYATNDNITYTVNPGVTLTVDGNWPIASSTGTNGAANTTLNFNGTCNIAKAFATPITSGKTCTVNIGTNGVLSAGTSCSPYSYTGGAATTFNVNGVFNMGTTLAPANFYVSPTTAVIAPVINVGSTGIINVYGTADFSNTTVTGTITGAGTFNLLSGATINTVNSSGLEPVAGPIRTTTRNFNAGAKYSYLGSVAQVTGSDLPATVSTLTITNTNGVSLSGATTVTGTLTVTAGSTLKNAYTFTNNGIATINGAFQIDEGGWATGTDFVYGAAGTLVFNNASGFYGLSGTPVFWPVTGSPANVTVQNTGGLELQIPRTVSGLFQTSTGVKNTFGNDLTVSGTVRLNSGGYFGNFSPTYTSTGTLEYNTGGSYGVYNEWGAGSGAGYGVPQNVSVLNTTAVNLSGARSIPGTLTLTSGKLSLGANDLTIGTAISGGSATSYIVTDGAGKVTTPATAAVTTLIPVGASASSYDPVNVTPTTTTTFAVKAYSTLSGTAPYGVRFNTKEWDLTPALASSTLIALTPSNLVESVSSPVIGHYVSGSYVNISATMTNSNTTYTGTFNTFSPFVTGANVDVTGITDRVENTVNAFTEANHLIVTGTTAGDIISVYGLNGQTVANVKANANQTVINMNKGLYLVNVKSSDKTTNFKVVLK